ncbi:regulator of nonsense transcripts UPF3-like isoform X1 [Nymphaea colorata]|nr:regulator of nonsense transcripts UPF3-like isoform X1 [Nymphaea colorata]
MKDPPDRTKVVLRHLPPWISQALLIEKVDSGFTGRYRWAAFRPGKISHKHMQCGRAYIDFKRPEDVLEFAEFFDGHVFVDEKGTRFQTVVEYAPSQRVPKSWSKKDGREGTILKDPEYLEFLEMLAKPVENLPSAEIQLERREAGRASGAKETLIVTPLMEFVRQKRAAKNGSQRKSSNGKLGGRTGRVSSATSHKRGPDKRRVSTPVYILRDNFKVSSGKDRSSYTVMARKDEQASGNSGAVQITGSELLEDDGGASEHVETGKQKVLLLKAKEREASNGSSAQRTVTSEMKNSAGLISSKLNYRREFSGSVVKSILSKKEVRQRQQQPAPAKAEQQMQPSDLGKDKRPPRPSHSGPKDLFSSKGSSASSLESDTKRSLNERTPASDSHGVRLPNDKPGRRIRNKERPDRGVWAPFHHPDAVLSLTTDDSLTLSGLPRHLPTAVVDSVHVPKQVVPSKQGVNGLEAEDGVDAHRSFPTGKHRRQDKGIHNARLGHGASSSPDLSLDQCETKVDASGANWSGTPRVQEAGRGSDVLMENGSHRCSRRAAIQGSKEADNLPNPLDGKPSKKGSSGYWMHEKQIWVQKSETGS